MGCRRLPIGTNTCVYETCAGPARFRGATYALPLHRYRYHQAAATPQRRISLDEINDWCKRMVATTIMSEASIFVADRRQYATDTFHVFDRVVLVGEELHDGTRRAPAPDIVHAVNSPAVEFRNVSYSVGGRSILRDVTLTIVGPGETVVLLGRSGSGKTTMLKMVNRLANQRPAKSSSIESPCAITKRSRCVAASDS